MTARIRSEITLWRVIVAIIFVTGMYATYVRFFEGFRASTNLSDQMPWGLWVGLGTLCGVGLSAAGFGISAAVYLLGMERYRPILRASILISFLGYCTVMVGYLYEIGLPWRFWHPVVMWNSRSVLFDVCVCIMTYFTVLTFEFAPAVIEKLPWKGLRETILRYHHKILIGVVLAGVLLSSMHQSFLGGLYLIAAGKVHPLWYSSNMHAIFYMSAIPAGLALTVMAVYLCMRSLNVRVDFTILSDCGRMIQMLLVVFVFFRLLDLVGNHALHYAFQRTQRSRLLLAGSRDVHGHSDCAAELREGAQQSRWAVLDMRRRGGRVHRQPAECVHQCLADCDGNPLRSRSGRSWLRACSSSRRP